MAIKVEVDDLVTKAWDYPCLKSSGEGRIVLFTGPSTGTIVNRDRFEYSRDWEEALFEPFVGKVTLSNG